MEIVSKSSGFLSETFGDVLTIIKQIIPSYFDIVIGLSTYSLYKIVNHYPWSLYYKAVETRKRKEEVKDGKEGIDEIKSLEKYLFYGSISAHILSTLAVFGVARYTKETIIRERTSIVFLLSALQNPIRDYIQHQRRTVNKLSYFVQSNKKDEKAELDSAINQRDYTLSDLKSTNKSLKHRVREFPKRVQQDTSNIERKTLEERSSFEKLTKEIEVSVKELKDSASTYINQVKV